jgi:hypothetical protein
MPLLQKAWRLMRRRQEEGLSSAGEWNRLCVDVIKEAGLFNPLKPSGYFMYLQV